MLLNRTKKEENSRFDDPKLIDDIKITQQYEKESQNFLDKALSAIALAILGFSITYFSRLSPLELSAVSSSYKTCLIFLILATYFLLSVGVIASILSYRFSVKACRSQLNELMKNSEKFDEKKAGRYDSSVTITNEVALWSTLIGFLCFVIFVSSSLIIKGLEMSNQEPKKEELSRPLKEGVSRPQIISTPHQEKDRKTDQSNKDKKEK